VEHANLVDLARKIIAGLEADTRGELFDVLVSRDDDAARLADILQRIDPEGQMEDPDLTYRPLTTTEEMD